jgi:hypothetical protein
VATSRERWQLYVSWHLSTRCSTPFLLPFSFHYGNIHTKTVYFTFTVRFVVRALHSFARLTSGSLWHSAPSSHPGGVGLVEVLIRRVIKQDGPHSGAYNVQSKATSASQRCYEAEIVLGIVLTACETMLHRLTDARQPCLVAQCKYHMI